MIDKYIIRKIIFHILENDNLHLKVTYNVTSPKSDSEYWSRVFKLLGPYKDITIKNYEHCSQSRGVEEQFIIVNFDFVFDTTHSTPFNILVRPCSIKIEMLEYLQFIREEKLRDLSVTPEDNIRKSISEYLEFDSDELFRSKFNLIRIFGGAIRDIIAEQPIHDIDILCGSKSIKFVESILQNNGYQYIEMLNGKDLQEMYSEIHVINEPKTWIKGKKIVQLIRPSVGFADSPEAYKRGFTDLIANVDLSCCGVSYDGETLHEDYPNALLHCQSKVFSVNKKAKMYSEKRVSHRIHKLTDRGWEEIENTISNNRDLKINIIQI